MDTLKVVRLLAADDNIQNVVRRHAMKQAVKSGHLNIALLALNRPHRLKGGSCGAALGVGAVALAVLTGYFYYNDQG